MKDFILYIANMRIRQLTESVKSLEIKWNKHKDYQQEKLAYLVVFHIVLLERKLDYWTEVRDNQSVQPQEEWIMLDVISDNGISVDWCDALVWVHIKSSKLAMHTKSKYAKFRETDGDKKKALELAINRLLQWKSL